MAARSRSARISLIACASTSSRMPSSSRKSEKLCPTCSGFTTDPDSCSRLKASSISCRGVLAVFLLKPCSNSSRLSRTQKMTRSDPPVRNATSRLPETFAEGAAVRHPDRPFELEPLNVLADRPPVLIRQLQEPVARRLSAGRGPVEGDRDPVLHAPAGLCENGTPNRARTRQVAGPGGRQPFGFAPLRKLAMAFADEGSGRQRRGRSASAVVLGEVGRVEDLLGVEAAGGGERAPDRRPVDGKRVGERVLVGLADQLGHLRQ